MTGVAPDEVERLAGEIASLSNNPTKLEPPRLLFPHVEEINGKWVIKVQIPASSVVHQTGGHVFLRSHEGDYRVSGLNRIAGIVNRKLGHFSEQRVLPFLSMSDLRPDLFKRARVLMREHKPKHPWATLSPEDLLKIAGFIRRDVFTGKVGYTLAAALMFGTDSIIQSVVPGYKFDALLRRHDIERYDDRLLVCTNLIDSFDLLMDFLEKHLNDPFYLEGIQRISIRSRIFRELVANVVAHREYVSAASATIKIYQDRVEFKNPNVPHGQGPIDPLHFTPYPKNPTICQFMIQLGRYESLGSGISNVVKYHPFYAPGAPPPSFIEGDMFMTIIPLAPAQPESRLESQPESRLESQPESQPESRPESMDIRILKLLSAGEQSKVEISAALGQRGISGQLNHVIRYLIEDESIERTIPDKPQSRLQKYRLTDKGRAALTGAR